MEDDRRSTETTAEPSSDSFIPSADVFARVSDAVYALDSEFQCTFINERAEALFTRATESATATADAVHSLFSDAHTRALESQRPLTVDAYHDSSDRWFEARCYPGETGVTVLVRDITERKTQEQALVDGNRRLRSVFEDAHDAIVVGDTDEIVAANPAASELLGLERSALSGRSLEEFVHDDYDIESARTALLEQGRLRDSVSLIRPDGSERVVEYTAVADVLPGAHLVILRDVTDSRRRKRQLERQRERLSALDHVNRVVREINDAIVDGSNRAQLEQVACESLADSPSYEFAFIADIDARSKQITHRVEAGIDDYVETIPLSTDADDPAGRGPAGTAIRTGTMQVSNDVFSDPSFEPWYEDAREHGYASAAAIPITHDDVLYGVLGVTSARRNAFTDEERDVIGQLGDILGHAIAALERRRVLLGEELIELELVIDDAVEIFDGPSMCGHSVWFDRVVRIDDERYLEYGTTAAETLPVVETLIESVPHWEGVTVIDESAGEVTFELTISAPPMIGVIDAHGGYVESAAIEDGDYTTTVRFSTGTDVRDVVDEIAAVYPGMRTVARRRVTPSRESIEQLRTRLAETLTDRQQVALETAYFGGYFEWPRHSSGEEVADAMGVTPATFHEHLRTAQRKLITAILEEPALLDREPADDP
ncbi:bacterio-opsin activator domain-containing protein [Natronorubrum sulfidifaciens]|uniref:Putative PAS/PAC sensor protein n=1 Tax=Natronorubrum sulfidifaciens JCM 14089 TaxID=1230460 RepID=L9WA16_9EURY|nr:bacterio-opsin activator domain-containing protein [Natronorubrum sulfidifaciens]ELY45153.1 putative PAS/PAC sensor protein [Natronorubrum sulfidifaciens JCM 14089]